VSRPRLHPALRALPILLLLAGFGCSEDPLGREDAVPVRVGRVALDPNHAPVLVLEEEGGPRWLPIWIGSAEAQSIASEIEKTPTPRPNTHDLAKRIIQGLHAEVLHVVVTELRKGTYYATLAIRAHGEVVEIDARPSDAIAIALRLEAPILVREALLDEAGRVSEPDESEQSVSWPPPRDSQRTGTSSATPPLNL
jgi:bifunctional DNase/RNase